MMFRFLYRARLRVVFGTMRARNMLRKPTRRLSFGSIALPISQGSLARVIWAGWVSPAVRAGARVYFRAK